MSSATPAASIGIDFGTSNTVVAIATPDGAVESLRFEHGGIAHGVYANFLAGLALLFVKFLLRLFV